VANQKGGCGKTTTTISLGSALAQGGRRVLLVDMDPQFALTRGLGTDPRWAGPTVREVLFDGVPLREATIREVAPSIDLVPSNLLLAKADLDLAHLPAGDSRLKQAMEEAALSDYDCVLIDCPPSLGKLTFNALAAASYLLVPVDSAPWALDTIHQLFELADDVRRYVNQRLRLLGVLVTKYQAHVTVCQQVRDDAHQRWPREVFDTTVRLSAKMVEAAYAGESILTWDRRSPVAEDYRALAREVETRLDVSTAAQPAGVHEHGQGGWRDGAVRPDQPSTTPAGVHENGKGRTRVHPK
jgi:chromosome partitioning protein